MVIPLFVTLLALAMAYRLFRAASSAMDHEHYLYAFGYVLLGLCAGGIGLACAMSFIHVYWK